jgi:hypothetical protein
MADLYRTTKKAVAANLLKNGFKADALGEGFYKGVTTDMSVTVQISGMWSHVEAYVGVRFDSINKNLEQAASKAGWKPIKSGMFKLKLLGLFREKVGDYCSSTEDLGVFCPEKSSVATSSDIIMSVNAKVDQMIEFTDLTEALRYAQTNSLVLPFGIYTIPAGAKATSDSRLWDWCNEHVSPYVTASDRDEYDRLLVALRENRAEAR